MADIAICPSCRAYLDAVAPGSYQSVGNTPKATQCAYHPTRKNWRVQRVMRTLKTWSLEQPGFVHPHARIVALVREGGVHRRTAEAIFFHYEAPMIDFLVSEGLVLTRNDGQGALLQVSAKGDQWIRVLEKQRRTEAA